MAVSRQQEWRFHLVRTQRGYQSTVFLCIYMIRPKPWLACNLKSKHHLERMTSFGKYQPPPPQKKKKIWWEQALQQSSFHSRHHLYPSKRVNPPELTINNKLKRANAMYIGQQFQVMRTFMSTCEFHTAVTQNKRKDDGTKITQSPGFAYMFRFISYLLYSWYTGQQSILTLWNPKGLSK